MKRTDPIYAVAAAAAIFAGAAADAANPNGGGSTASGVISFDQAKAEAGGVTANDAPGFPVTVSQPGSYRLMSNLTVTDPRVDAIQITASNVTLDLNGFTIQGPVACSGRAASFACTPSNSLGRGIRSSSTSFTAVRNGSVLGFQAGVTLGSFATVEDLNVANSAGYAIATEHSSLVARNKVSGALYGILATGSIRDNVVFNTRVTGIDSAGATVISGNTVHWSGGTGISAYRLSDGHAGVSNNVIWLTVGPQLSGGVSLGDTPANLCNGVKC